MKLVTLFSALHNATKPAQDRRVLLPPAARHRAGQVLHLLLHAEGLPHAQLPAERQPVPVVAHRNLLLLHPARGLHGGRRSRGRRRQRVSEPELNFWQQQSLFFG